jgi:hypothetical protein
LRCLVVFLSGGTIVSSPVHHGASLTLARSTEALEFIEGRERDAP